MADSFQISAKEQLEFTPCFGGFECAKLKVPLDYFNGTYPDSTVSIAIAKVPAKVSVDDPRYGGPILINPGGPGGPGAQTAIAMGSLLQTIVDSEIDPEIKPDTRFNSEKYFDIIGFDPRGIAETEPAAECMPDPASQFTWTLRESVEGILGSSDAALGRLWSMTHAFGNSCAQAMDSNGGPDIKQYMSTAFVARDMLEIAEKHAEYVAKKTSRSVKSHVSQLNKYTSGKTKVQYWGFSYGTYLGYTFASMFPDRVGRLVLDGVVSSRDYNYGLGNRSIMDAEKAMSSFYTFCLNTGASECWLAENATGTDEIEDRVKTILQSLYHDPIPLNSANGPEVLTYSDMRLIIFSACYQPRYVFPMIAQLLREVEQRRGPILDQLALALRPSHIYHCPIPGSPPVKSLTVVPQIAILCSDGHGQLDLTMQEFENYWHSMDKVSPTFGPIWSMLKMRCAAWPIRASYKHGDVFGGNTSYPILFISNTADPVTPLRSGREMHGKFGNSAHLIQDSAGHCSISTPTLCTQGRIRAYFQTGELPAPNTVCIPPTSPWSLNSTDPDSPFYDPSLDGSETILVPESADSKLQSAGIGVQMWLAAQEEGFGFERLLGTQRIRSFFARRAQAEYANRDRETGPIIN